MKRIIGYLLSFVIAISIVFSNANTVWASGTISVTTKNTTVKVGDQITINVSISPAEYGVNARLVKSSNAFEFVSDDIVYSDGGSPKASITVKAVAEGSCTFSVSTIQAFDENYNETSMSSGSVTVNVTSAATSNSGSSKGQTGNNNNNSGSDSSNNNGNDNTDKPDDTDKEPEKSSDSSLSSLIISAGSLSPEFAAGTKDYTTTVDYSVSSLAVTATPADSKATVTSVTGNDSLEVGENTVSIVVTAENGATGTYNIVVTRRSEDDPENSDQQENWKKFDINGTEWTMVNDIPEDVVPEGFEHSKTVIDGLEYNTLHSTFGDITLIYMQSDSGNSLFVYDAAQNAAYDYVRINSESHFIVVLLPNVDDVPEGYDEVSLSIEGKGVVTAYQSKDDKADKDFYLVYAMNDQGDCGWYTYDSVDGTYIRTDVTAPTVAQEENDTVKDKIIPGVENKYLAVAAALVIIIIILLIILIVTNVRRKKNGAEEYEDEDEYSDDEVAETDVSDDEYDTVEPESEENETAENDDTEDTDASEAIDEIDETDNTEEADDNENSEADAVEPKTIDDEQDTETEESVDAETDTAEENSKAASDDVVEEKAVDDEEILPQIDISSVMDASSEETENTETALEEPVVRRTVEIKNEDDSIEQQVQQAIDEFSKKEDGSESKASDEDNDDLEIIDLN